VCPVLSALPLRAGKWIQNTGTKYDNQYVSAIIYTETDPAVAYAQSDQCWLLEGLWMAGGNAPSVGLQGPGDPNPGQGKNRLVQPDLVEKWQDRIFTFHMKDLGSGSNGSVINDQGTSVANVGDNAGPGDTVYPYGAVPWNANQDAVPFQQIFDRIRNPECHEYLFERDGMSNTVTSNSYWRKIYIQSHDMFDKLVLNRDPNTVRKPFPIPSTPAEWAASSNAIGSRPPSGKGAPGPECPPELNGENRVGYKVRVDFKGTWARSSNRADAFTYQWFRDGNYYPVYQSAPIGTKPGCTCDTNSNIYYVIQPEDSGHKISALVTNWNDEGASSSVETEQVTVPGRSTDAQVEQDLEALRQRVFDMHLAAGPTSELTNTIDAIRKSVMKGNSPCQDLDNLKNRIAVYASRGKISPSQQSELNSRIDAIKAEYPC